MHRRLPALLVIATLLLPTAALAGGGSTQASISGLSPTDLEHGETTQTIHVGGRIPDGTTELAVNLTPLSAVGVDLSGATVSVNQSAGGLEADPAIERDDGEPWLRVRLSADGETAFRLDLRLRGLDTTDAGVAWLRYGATVDGASVESNRFRVEPAGMPDLRSSVEGEPLVTNRTDLRQRVDLRVFDAAEDTPVTVTLDLAPLAEAGVPVRDAAVGAEVVDGDLVLADVRRDGTRVVLEGTTGTADVSTVEVVLSGLDTRGATPARDLQYPLTVEAPAGSKTLGSEPFSLYRPDEAPTPTTTIVESPTATETATSAGSPAGGTSPGPTTSAGGQPGFTAAATTVALLVSLGLLWRRG